MENYLIRTSSTGSLSSKRPADGDPEKWQSPKRTALATAAPKIKTSAPTSNRFDTLQPDQILDGNSRTTVSTKPKNSRIPPIVLSIKPDWTHRSIQELVSSYAKNFHLKYRANNKVAIYPYSATSHQAIKEGLLNKADFHTFTRKDEKTFKAVIRGLPSNVEEDLPEELASLGFPGCKVTKLRTPASSVQSSNALFLVQFPTETDISKFKKTRFICSCVVEIEKFKPKHQHGTQCYRCQNFGHTSRNCNLAPRCIKCTGNHLSKDCSKKDRDELPECCNCKDQHAANYRLCPARQAYLNRTQNLRGNKVQSQNTKKPLGPRIPSTNQFTWAQVASNSIGLAGSKSSINDFQPPQQHHPKFINQVPDPTVMEMLQILNVLRSIKSEFLECKSMLDKVILILSHLGHSV